MKKQILIVALLGLCTIVNAQQWGGVTDQTGTIYRSGFVGIGTSTPLYKLSVGGNIGFNNNLVSMQANANLFWGDGTSGDFNFRTMGAPQTLGGYSDRMTLKFDGKVGIGTTVPAQQLEVSTSNSNGGIQINNTSNTASGIWFKNQLLNGSTGSWLIGSAGTGNTSEGAGNFFFYDLVNNKNRFLIQQSTGNVGIGTTNNITAPLTVQSGAGGHAIKIIGRADDYGFIEFYKNNGTTISGSIYSKTDRLTLADAAGVEVLNIKGGLVGIGTPDPLGMLHLKIPNTSLSYGILIEQTNTNGGYGQTVRVKNNNTKAITVENAVGQNAEVFSVKGNGQTAIGCNDAGSYMLAVNGKMAAREIKVTLQNPWPDYVFNADYKLKTLSEVEKYIEENKHLPNIPSADDLKDKDYSLDIAEMQTKQMEKIEEVYLYLIEIKKELETLKKENNSLKTLLNSK